MRRGASSVLAGLIWVGLMAAAAAGATLSPVSGLALTVTRGPENPEPLARLQQNYGKLEAEASRHRGSKQAEDWAQMAVLDYQMAEQSLVARQPGEAERRLTDARQLADRAMTNLRAEFAQGKTDRMKDVEICWQTISYHLRRIAAQVQPAGRGRLLDFYRYFADADAEVLHMMFSPKSERPNAAH